MNTTQTNGRNGHQTGGEKLSLRVNDANENHHLWNNNGTWWVHYTVHLADFTPPAGKLVIIVNAENVGEVKPANPIFVHDNAHAVLHFSPRVMLAVRETVAEAKAKIAAARPRAKPVARARARPHRDVA